MQPPDFEISVSPARPHHAAELTHIAHAAKRHWGYPDAWMAIWRDQLTFTPQDVADRPTFVARGGDRCLGVYALSRTGDVACLEHFWVLPEAMGRGVGRTLFEHAVGQAQARGATLLEIESDPNAVGFYRHMGCRPAGETVYDLDGQPRRLPVLHLALQPAAAAGP
ncbi:MAG: GNAT family N-acetyltransferase [Caldilineales bacterium]